MRAIRLAVLVLPLVSCATAVELTSVKDPTARDQPYSRIVVAVLLDRLDLRQAIESAFIDRLARDGVGAIPSLELLPPTRGYSTDELVAVLNSVGAQGILTLTIAGVHQSHSPLVGNVPSRALVFDRNVYQFELRLLDSVGLQPVWLATSEGSVNIVSGVDTLGPKLADRAVAKLRSDGLLP